jgi:hypothetical protein
LILKRFTNEEIDWHETSLIDSSQFEGGLMMGKCRMGEESVEKDLSNRTGKRDDVIDLFDFREIFGCQS